MKIKLTGLFIVLFMAGLYAQPEAQSAFSAGVKHLKAREFNEAEKLFTIAIETGETEKGLKMSYIYKGFALKGQKQYDGAIVCFDKAIEIDPLDAASYIDRAKVYIEKKDFDNSIKDFLHVLSIDSVGRQAEAAYYYLGRIEMIQSKNAEAIKYFDKLLTVQPADAEAFFLRGTAKSNIQEYKESIADFDMAIKYSPNYMEAYTNRAFSKINLLTSKGNLNPIKEETKSACKDFEKAMELGDQRYDLYEIHCTDMLEEIKDKNKSKE